jgi:hypothetical protein
MPSMIELFERQKRDIDRIIDTSYFRLFESEDPINRLMPLQSYAIRELLMMKFQHSKPTIGSIVAEGQEIPLSRARAVLTEELLSDCKIGKAYGFTAKHYELLDKMGKYMQINGGAAIATEIERYFFGIFADLAPQIINRLTMMTFRVLMTGSCSFTDPVTGAQVALAYPDIDSALLPAALTSTALWSAASTATGLNDLRVLARAYYTKHGKYPDHMLCRQFNIWELGEQNSTKRAYLSSMGGTGIIDGTDLPGLQLNELQVVELIKRWTGIPDVMMFDALYSEENAAGTVTNKYYLDDGYVAMIDDGLLERSLVPTVENDFKPGVFAAIEIKSQIPRREQLAAVANGIPSCFDARKLCAQKMSNTTFTAGSVA